MNSDDLTKEQAAALKTALFPGINFLVRLKSRMQKAGFPQTDKLFELVCAAYDASWLLSHELHYMSCDGVYRVPKQKKPEAADSGMDADATMPECDESSPSSAST
jgi:hypothetical protein